MNPEKFISLELAKKIAEVAKEKGVELPESEYWHSKYRVVGGKPNGERWVVRNDKRVCAPMEPDVPAYDTQELGLALPPRYSTGKGGCGFIFYVANGVCPGWDAGHLRMEAKTEPEARGKMLLYLLKNDLLK